MSNEIRLKGAIKNIQNKDGKLCHDWENTTNEAVTFAEVELSIQDLAKQLTFNEQCLLRFELTNRIEEAQGKSTQSMRERIMEILSGVNCGTPNIKTRAEAIDQILALLSKEQPMMSEEEIVNALMNLGFESGDNPHAIMTLTRSGCEQIAKALSNKIPAQEKMIDLSYDVKIKKEPWTKNFTPPDGTVSSKHAIGLQGLDKPEEWCKCHFIDGKPNISYCDKDNTCLACQKPIKPQPAKIEELHYKERIMEYLQKEIK